VSALAKQDAIRREGYFYKVFLVVMFSSVLPLILLLALFLPLSTQQITAELEATYINSMNAINSSVNMVFNQIVEDCLLISRDTTFAEYIKIPSAQVRQLESAPARYTDAVMDNLGKYIRIKGKLYSNLSTMKFMMPFVDSVYFLDVGKQLILTSNNKFSPVQNFSDQDFINRLRDYSAIKYISPIRRCVHPDGSVIDVITVFINSVFQHDGGVFAMNIDSAKLADYLFGDFDGSSGYMLIMSEAGVASDMRNFPEQVAAMLSDTDLIQKLSDLEDRASLFERGYLFVKNASTNKHWFYLSMLDVDQVFSASIRLRNILLVIFGGLFTLSLLLAVFSSNRLYHPIRLLRKMLTGYVQLPEEKDVFRSLGAYVALSENEKQDMKSQIHTLTPYYRENILLFLLYRNAVSAEPIDNRKQFSEWGFQQGGLALLMFGISFTQDALSVVQPPISVAIKQYLVLKLEMALSRTGIAAQDISGRFFLLCNVSSDDYRRMYDFAKSIANSLIRFCFLSLSYFET